MLAKFAKAPGCSGCDLAQLGVGFVPADGPPASPLLFVGEAAGYNEAISGVPFIGAAGGLFNARMLPMAGLSREQVRVHNVLGCRPPNDWLAGAPWQFSAITHCRQYLQESLNAPELQVVVTLGDTALRSVLDLWGTDGVRVQDFHGTRHRDPSGRFWVVPTYHPSHLQRGAINLLDVVRSDIDIARGLVNRSFVPRPVSIVLDPPVEHFRSWAHGVIQRALRDAVGTWLAVDIETPDKSGGRDEGELSTEDRSTQIDRVNFSVDPDEGWTVPYIGPYIPIIDQLLNSGAWLWMWNKWYDESRLRFNGHKFIAPDGSPVVILDEMWLAHHYQSDWPLGLGFWAPFASDYGAWKHLGKSEDQANKTRYAAIDGFQTRRVADYLVERAMKLGLWEAFYRHTHLREQYVLRPAHELGCPISIERLDAFHAKLQVAAAERLTKIQASEMAGTLRPKAGYAKKPKGAKCPDCVQGLQESTHVDEEQPTKLCSTCEGSGELEPTPPKSILGKSGEKGDNAKQQYMEEGVRLVERKVSAEVLVCGSCQQRGVPATHNCLRPKGKKRRAATPEGDEGSTAVLPVEGGGTGPELTRQTDTVVRWFWQLPFNPDSSQQILAFIKGSGLEPGRAKKTRKETADKETLKKLYKQTGNIVYLLLLEYKAVKKVDSTYAVGVKKRIWSDGRLHPQPTFRPSTLRDSYVSPNIQNCLAQGTYIEVVRDCSVHPWGIPIEDVRVGDWAYTYDADARLSLQRVTRAWRTGVRDVVRLHWKGKSQRPRHGYVDLTPDHLVRLTSGDYRPAGQLVKGDRLLSLHRSHGDGYETLYATGHKNKREHQFVWETLTHRKDPHVHHKNSNKRDNRPTSLLGMDVGPHFREHNTGESNPRWDMDNPGSTPAARAQHASHKHRAAKRRADPTAFMQKQRDTKRTWYQKNRAKRKKIHNHIVVAIEHLPHPVPVYDLEVESDHNFIAGEICVHNCIADKDKKGVGSLAAGFRDCIVADPGYRLVELDYSGIEAVDTGWLCGDPNQVRLATLGVHAYLTSHLLHAERKLDVLPSMAWSDADLTALFSEVKKKFPEMYDKAKRTVHGTNYGLTTYGMHNNFPEVFATVKEAEKTLDMYYALCPKLPEYHSRMRDHAYKHGYIGGSYVDDYTLLTSGGHHPWGYIHWFYGVMSFRPLNETAYRRLQWIAKNRMNRAMHPRVAIIHNRPFEKVLGEDSKRVIAFPPQSIAAGTLKEAELMLFHPDSPDYIGELADGRTPLIAPIHDSLLLHVPDRIHEWVIMHCAEVMRRPIPTMPLPAEWNMGTHLRVNVAAKVSPVGGSWAECDDVKLPDMAAETARETLYTPVDDAEWEDVEDLQVEMKTREVA